MPTETRWGNRDLIIKPVITAGSTSTPADLNTRYFQMFYQAAGGPNVPTASGKVRPIIIDGKPGPQTRNAILAFQKAVKIEETGKLDQWTWFRTDWIAYNLYGDRWKPCAENLTSMAERGPAILKGHNGIILSPAIRVNSRGLAIEGQRLTDVVAVYLNLALGLGRAVLRYARGTSVFSRHAKSIARDQMGDYDGDKLIEEHEKRQIRGLIDYMMQRANLLGSAGFGQHGTIERRPDNRDETFTSSIEYRGVDLLSVIVLGNLRYQDGTRMFPQFPVNKDVSWSARRNSLKTLDDNVHVYPFHEHLDCCFNAPTRSPWIPRLG